jgi:hypothetical protein
MVVIALALAVAFVGAILYGFVANAKISTLGLVAYGAGLLAFLLEVANGAVKFIK